MSYVVKFIISLLIFLIACVLWYLSQIIDWDEYTPKKDCSDFARHMLENYTIEEVEIMLKRIYDVVPYIDNLKKRVEELTQKKLKETFPKFYK